ncbi:MAG: hypothetical protein ACKOPO_11775 [Novosphingobium sp.]
MRAWSAAALALAFSAGAAQAALPPKYQRLRELQAILEAPGVASGFPDDQPIARVEFVSPDRYRVTSPRCAMIVAIVSDPSAPAMPGPRRFLVKPGKAECAKRP